MGLSVNLRMHVSESTARVPSFIYWKVKEAQGILFSQEF